MTRDQNCHMTGLSSLAGELRKCTEVGQQPGQTLRKFTELPDSSFLNARLPLYGRCNLLILPAAILYLRNGPPKIDDFDQ